MVHSGGGRHVAGGKRQYDQRHRPMDRGRLSSENEKDEIVIATFDQFHSLRFAFRSGDHEFSVSASDDFQVLLLLLYRCDTCWPCARDNFLWRQVVHTLTADIAM